ncbi:Glutamate receptor ionotropic, kainate 3, partial [Fragariocoptes setiger]
MMGHNDYLNFILSCIISLLLVILARSPDSYATAALDEIRIGVIMKDDRLHDALNRAVDKVNADPSILFGTKLVPLIETVDSENTFDASRAVCRLLEQRVWAIIGPESPYLTPIIQSITANYQIPFITISWQFASSLGSNQTTGVSSLLPLSSKWSSSWPSVAHNFSVHFYPHVDQLSVAYYDLVRYKNWKSFTIIYDSTEDLVKIKDVLQATFSDTTEHLMMHCVDLASEEYSKGSRQLGSASDEPNDVLSYRKLMKDLRKLGVENVLLSVSVTKINKILREASKVGLLSVYNDYVVTNLDVHKLNLSSFQPLMTNIS